MSRSRFLKSASDHEIGRIKQFTAKARDEEHLRQLLLVRAARCGPEKLERFIAALKQMGRQDLAGFIEMVMKK